MQNPRRYRSEGGNLDRFRGQSSPEFAHERCNERKIIKDEVEIVGARVNIFFTRAYNAVSSVFSEAELTDPRDSEFSVFKLKDQIIIECAHPVWKSQEWLEQLKRLIIKKSIVTPNNPNKEV